MDEKKASVLDILDLPRYTYGYQCDEWGMNKCLSTYESDNGQFYRVDDVHKLVRELSKKPTKSFDSHEALIDDMENFRKQVLSDPIVAREFLDNVLRLVSSSKQNT